MKNQIQWVMIVCGLSVLIALSGCTPKSETKPKNETKSEISQKDTQVEKDLSLSKLDYSNDAFWMCKPGIENDACKEELAATEALPDGGFGEPIAHEVNPDPDFDCFYIYWTTDLSRKAGNHIHLIDNELFKGIALSQAGRFNSVCRVFAPYYRQMTMGTYYSSQPEYETIFNNAYGDVDDAFEYYMKNENNGRNVVLIGTSQGAHMLTRLVQEKFDNVPEMRKKLISAILLGGLYDVYVPSGETVGGSFKNIPLCTNNSQTGCVIAYNAISAPGDALVGRTPPPEGNDVACVNPAALNGGKGSLTSYFKSNIPFVITDTKEVTTPYIVYRDALTAECVGKGHGRGLVIGVNSDKDGLQESPINFQLLAAAFGSKTLLHILEIDFAQGNLIELVKTQAESMPEVVQKEAPKTCDDLSGTWEFVETIDLSGCAAPTDIETLHTQKYVQNGCQLTVFESGAPKGKAEIRGNKIHWPGWKFVDPTNGSTITAKKSIAVFDGKEYRHEIPWTSDNGMGGCRGKTIWIGKRK